MKESFNETGYFTLGGRPCDQPFIGDLLFPDHAMYEAWQKLLPGFEWLSWKSFFLGWIEAYGYGWYFALIWVPIYNFVVLRNQKEESR